MRKAWKKPPLKPSCTIPSALGPQRAYIVSQLIYIILTDKLRPSQWAVEWSAFEIPFSVFPRSSPTTQHLVPLGAGRQREPGQGGPGEAGRSLSARHIQG